MQIKSLGNTNFQTIYNAFNKAFANYDVQINSEQLKAMLKRRGFNPNLSFASFKGEEITSFTFNGIGDFEGIPTAYDTGTGTLQEYRGQGLATQIFEYSIPYLKEMNIKQYLLEVLQHNTKAVSVYKNWGFEVAREFNYFIQKNTEVKNIIRNTNAYSIRFVNIEAISSASHFCDFHASWQNTIESIKRSVEEFILLGAFINEKLVGYCVFETASGDITQLAVDKQHRRKGIASILLKEIIVLNKIDIIKVLNTSILCDSITGFLQAKNMPITGKQFEMIKKI